MCEEGVRLLKVRLKFCKAVEREVGLWMMSDFSLICCQCNSL